MTTFDLAEVRSFVADLDARMTLCQDGEAMESRTRSSRRSRRRWANRSNRAVGGNDEARRRHPARIRTVRRRVLEPEVLARQDTDQRAPRGGIAMSGSGQAGGDASRGGVGRIGSAP